jgi:exoribonuclease-2
MAGSHILFDEEGAFKAGTVLSDAGASLQVESASGKRTKVKSSHVMLRFATPAPAELIQQAQLAADEIELDFLWECAPQEEFDFHELARDYFGEAPSAVQAAALLLRVHAAPVYFYRKGRGRYRAAPPDTLKAALAAVERKREQAERVESWAQALAAGEVPEAIAQQAPLLLVRPDKNGPEWKALERACALKRQPAAQLLLQSGAFADAHALHLACFLAEQFPRGNGFGTVDVDGLQAGLSSALADLPLAAAEPFSIDDSTTTEIDDCLSVQTRPDGRLRVGVHIAAPALLMPPGSAWDRLARDRMSTVYMPGDKITMLPDALVECFSLEAPRVLPTLSLYADLDESGTQVLATETRLERIRVAANLRHDQLDEVVTESRLADASDALDGLEQAEALRVLWRLTLALSEARDAVRGRPEARHRTDFSFYLDLDPQGAASVRIVQRRRDAPLDRIVAELMILANATWGRWLADHDTLGIYRAQAPGGRVLMTTQPMGHQGLGVAQYTWSTSPLRRYVDLVNQRQLIALARQETPPHVRGDADVFAIISAFDARYSAYADFQSRMERYWCLRWVAQHGATPRMPAVILRDDLVRLQHAPLFLRLPELPAQGLSPGAAIWVDLIALDELELQASARFAGVRPAAGDAPLDLEEASPEQGVLQQGGEAMAALAERPPADEGGAA